AATRQRIRQLNAVGDDPETRRQEAPQLGGRETLRASLVVAGIRIEPIHTVLAGRGLLDAGERSARRDDHETAATMRERAAASGTERGNQRDHREAAACAHARDHIPCLRSVLPAYSSAAKRPWIIRGQARRPRRRPPHTRTRAR